MQTVRINDQVLLLNDHDEATCYLVTGSERALLIDTANGYVDMHAFCSALTDLPLTVVQTHGHCDHIYGNVYFEEACLHPADNAVFDSHFAFPEVQKLFAKHALTPARKVPLRTGELFDLGGGLVLEVVPLAGHTAGSVGFLDRKHRILFSGDGALPHLWMQLPESGSIALLLQTLLTLRREYGADFDHLLTGHGRALVPAAVVDGLIRGCEQLLRGERQADVPYRWFGGECLAHPDELGVYDRIVYDETKL